MKNNLHKFGLFCFLFLGSFIQAQENISIPQDENSKKMGINKANPQRTLDVNGGVRLKTPGDAKKVLPLGIDKNKQLIIMPTSKNEARLFQKRRIRIPVPIKKKGEAVSYDLGIKHSDYLVNVISAKIVRLRANNTYTSSVMSLQGISESEIGQHGVWENGIGDLGIADKKLRDGWAGVIGTDNYQNPDAGRLKFFVPQNNLKSGEITYAKPENQTFIFYPVPKVYLTQSQAGSYIFNATYLDSEDIEINAINYWQVDLLVIKKFIGIEEEVITGTVDENGTFTKTSGNLID